MYYKETTMAGQCIIKKQQWLDNVLETTMAGQCIIKKQQWLDNVL